MPGRCPGDRKSSLSNSWSGGLGTCSDFTAAGAGPCWAVTRTRVWQALAGRRNLPKKTWQQRCAPSRQAGSGQGAQPSLYWNGSFSQLANEASLDGVSEADGLLRLWKMLMFSLLSESDTPKGKGLLEYLLMTRRNGWESRILLSWESVM